MERKFKVNESTAEGSSADGAQSKEEALDKLRKMEWKRNSQDTWHLARSNSRGNDVQERKKYNKDEDNYFDGTRVPKTKNKKLRKPRVSETSTVMTGFAVSQSSPAPPQVNAWAQKKGSALFQGGEGVDEEDQAMKMAIKESLKSIEDDERRRFERLKMTNLEVPTSTQIVYAEKDWEEEFVKKECYSESNVCFQEDSPEGDLHFVETEESPNINQRHRSNASRARKSSPRENSAFSSRRPNYDLPESEKKGPSFTPNRNVGSKESVEAPSHIVKDEEPNNDFYEPSRPQVKYSKPIEQATSSSSYITPSESTMLYRTSVKQFNENTDDLSSSFDTTLTFGVTQGLFEKVEEDNEFKHTGNPHNFKNEFSSYPTKATGSNAQIKASNSCEPSETDILLHNFIRHDPPSNLNSLVHSTVDMSALRQFESNGSLMLPTSLAMSSQNLNSAQSYITHQLANTEDRPVSNGLVSGIQISNDRDSSSSVSGSPLQNITPYGSYEKEIASNIRAGVQVPTQIGSLPYACPYNIENNEEGLVRHLQSTMFLNQKVSPAEFSSAPTPIRGAVPLNSHVGQPQFCLPNANMLLPTFQGQSISPLLLQQAYLQQVQMPSYLSQLMALDAARLQQAQLASGIEELDNSVKDQTNINQSQMQNSHQALTPQTQNSPQMLASQAQNNPMVLAPQVQNSPQILTPQVQNSPQQLNPQIQNSSQVFASQIQNNPQVLASQVQNNSQALPPQLPSNQHLLAQTQLLKLQNHPQILSLQSQPSMEIPTPKQEELLQQHILQGTRAQSGRKTQEELAIEYQNVVQHLQKLHEEMLGTRTQPPTPLAQPGWGVTSSNPPLSLPVNQFFPMGVIPQLHPQLIQHSRNTGLSPTIQHAQQNLPGSMNISPEMDTAQEPTQTSTELMIGRGRGRIH